MGHNGTRPYDGGTGPPIGIAEPRGDRRLTDCDRQARDRRSELPVCEADADAAPIGSARGKTFASFEQRDFRYFWSGALLSNVGTWIQIVALGWLVHEITGSELALGLLNFMNGIPVLLFILFAGAVADRVDRRQLLIWLQVAMIVQAVALGVLTVTGNITMPIVYALTLVGGTVSAFMFPAWQATLPDLVPRPLLLNAIALNSAQFNGARLIGPMVGAAVFARFGIAGGFFANAISYAFVIVALALIHPHQERHPAEEGQSRLGEFVAGLQYARSHRAVAILLLTTAAITILGMPFAALLPAVADKVLHSGSTGYSLLLAANGLGALLGALAVASLPPNANRPRLIRWSTTAMGVLLVAFAASKLFWLSAAILVGVGVAFMVSTSSINTSLQAAVPPRIRGRVMSLFVLSFMGMMPIGSLAFGAIAKTAGSPSAIGLGGGLLALVGAMLLFRPTLLTSGMPESYTV